MPEPTGATRIMERQGQASSMLVRQARLSVTAGQDQGTVFEMQANPITVGKDPTCDLVINDPAVSGQHFRISPQEQGFLLTDLDSTNGTFVAGLRVKEVFLNDSAQISLGETNLGFSIATRELEIPLSDKTRFGPLLGHSVAMRAVISVLERVADNDATVMLEGESGTGKGQAARALHTKSKRSGELFVSVDCGAIPANLIESELFGHAKGAFTGAEKDRIGPFEEAAGGTVFIDEIGELPLELQPKLLGALESREVKRVGENVARPFSARIVTATNRNLEQEVAAGRFRQDLYYRISVIKLRMPPLRERGEEVPRLASHFATELGQDPGEIIPEAVMKTLQAYHWPGNVRELRNVVERLAALPGLSPQFYLDGKVRVPDGPVVSEVEVPVDQPFHEGKRLWLERFERAYMTEMYKRCDGNISQIARVCGLSRQSCHRLLKRYALAD